MVHILAFRPSCAGFDSQCCQKNSEEKIVDDAELNQWPCLEESGQWFENVDRTHLALANEKLVIQNKLFCAANKSMTPEDHLISSTSVSNNLKLSLKSSQWMKLRCSWTLKWIIFEEKMKWSDCWNNSWKCNRILKSSNDDWTETGWTFARNVGTSVELEPVNLYVARAVVVVQWSASCPSTPTIWVPILLAI